MEIGIMLLLGIGVAMLVIPVEKKLLWRLFHWIDRRRGNAMPRSWYDY